MAYETEKNRLASLITGTVAIPRSRDDALETEATKRAYEASFQTGMNVGNDDGYDLIQHPTQEERQRRLGIPSTVYTAELATWNYLHNDPISAAASGLLTSPPHRAVLDNSFYKHWGIGIYTRMPAGETNELYRRWWIILWFANVSIAGAAVATPSETFAPKYVQFGAGTHHGYRFGYDGRILSSKTLNLTRSSMAHAKGRGKIPERPGTWLLMEDGFFADHWVQEHGFWAAANLGKLA